MIMDLSDIGRLRVAPVHILLICLIVLYRGGGLKTRFYCSIMRYKVGSLHVPIAFVVISWPYYAFKCKMMGTLRTTKDT